MFAVGNVVDSREIMTLGSSGSFTTAVDCGPISFLILGSNFDQINSCSSLGIFISDIDVA